METLNVLELYSGIGGMHFALKESRLPAEVITAADINPVANTVYQSNFPHVKLLSKNILSLTSSLIDDLKVDMILMSPPCQPYTRIGKKGDISDRRSDSLSHLINILPQVSCKLKYILLENVKGFETSKARNNLIESLKQTFSIAEFMINPLQFGIPNSRERYYLLARRLPFSTVHTELITNPKTLCEVQECFSLKEALEFSDDSPHYNEYLVPKHILYKRFKIMDIVTKECKRSCCFTKAYGRYIEGTGSVYCPHDEATIRNFFENIETVCNDHERQQELLDRLRLRFFTPTEVSRLMGFPKEFKFPDGVTIKQRYNLLGNSLNVKVVSFLINFIVTNSNEHVNR